MTQTEQPWVDEPAPQSYDSTRLALTKDDFQKIDADQSNSLSLLELMTASKSGAFTGEKLSAINGLVDRIIKNDIPDNRVQSLSDFATGKPPEIPNWHDPLRARLELSKSEFMLVDTNNDGLISPAEIPNAKHLSPMKQHAVQILSDSKFQDQPGQPLDRSRSLLQNSNKSKPMTDINGNLIQKELAKSKSTWNQTGDLLANSAVSGLTTMYLSMGRFTAGGATEATLVKGASESLVKGPLTHYSKGFYTSLAAGGAITADHMLREQMYGADAKSWESSSLTVPLALTLGSNVKQKAALTGLALLSGHGIDYAVPAPSWVPESLKHFTTYDAVGIGLTAAIPTKTRLAKAALMTAGWAGSNSLESYFSK